MSLIDLVMQANEWHTMLIKQIRYQNTLALHSQSRLPEVVEWYYQLQTELNRKHAFLLKSLEVYISFPSAHKQDVPHVSVFTVAMTEDRSGLVLSIVSHDKKFSRAESLNNGRIILFADIIGAVLPLGSWMLSKENRFPFTLVTKEDQLQLEMEALGVTWLQAVRDMVMFVRIPAPSGRSVAAAFHDRSSSQLATVNALVEFSANSGVVFACSNDVQLIIESLGRLSSKSPVILDIGQRISTVLKLIPDMRCNKEAAMMFGERMEEITRVLGDPEVGILYLSREADKSLLNFHLSTFNGKLSDVIQYLSAQTKRGWLQVAIASKLADNAKLRFEAFDLDLVSIINTLIKAMSIAHAVPFERREYSMAVDVRKSVEALGGIEAIHRDMAKERALAKLIQADGPEVHAELEDFIRRHAQGGSSSYPRARLSVGSYHTSSDEGSSPRSSWRSCLRILCCCCCCCFRRNNKPLNRHSSSSSSSRSSKIQLQEPLVS